MLVQESRRVKQIMSRETSWPAWMLRLAAMKYRVPGSIAQRFDIPSVYYWVWSLTVQKCLTSVVLSLAIKHILINKVKKPFNNL